MQLRTKPFCDVCKREVDSLEEVEHFGKLRLVVRCHGEREAIDFASDEYVIDVRGVAFRSSRRLQAAPPEPRRPVRHPLFPDYLFEDPQTAAARRYADGWERVFGARVPPATVFGAGAGWRSCATCRGSGACGVSPDGRSRCAPQIPEPPP